MQRKDFRLVQQSTLPILTWWNCFSISWFCSPFVVNSHITFSFRNCVYWFMIPSKFRLICEISYQKVELWIYWANRTIYTTSMSLGYRNVARLRILQMIVRKHTDALLMRWGFTVPSAVALAVLFRELFISQITELLPSRRLIFLKRYISVHMHVFVRVEFFDSGVASANVFV